MCPASMRQFRRGDLTMAHIAGAAKATGGKVSAENTKWYLMDLKWYPEGKCRLSDREATLKIPSQEGGRGI